MMADNREPRRSAEPDATPPAPTERLVTPAEAMQDRQRQAAREVATQRPRRELDETIPGGRYLLDDGETLVDANGKPLKKGD